jgi:hypothetical protein
MTTVMRSEKWPSSVMFLALTVGLAVLFGSSGSSLAAPKDPIYNVCACACYDPTTGFGELLADIQNTAGVPCGAYNGRACSLDGGTRTGTTKYCGGYKPGGTRAGMLAPSLEQNAPVLQQTPTTPGGMRAPTTGTIQRRGIEGEQPAEPTPGAPPSPDQPSGTK